MPVSDKSALVLPTVTVCYTVHSGTIMMEGCHGIMAWSLSFKELDCVLMKLNVRCLLMPGIKGIQRRVAKLVAGIHRLSSCHSADDVIWALFPFPFSPYPRMGTITSSLTSSPRLDEFKKTCPGCCHRCRMHISPCSSPDLQWTSSTRPSSFTIIITVMSPCDRVYL